MSPPELLGDLAAAFLARTWHRQQGDPVTDPIENEARRVFDRAYQRRHPNATAEQADAAWTDLPDGERTWLLSTAGKVLTTAEEVTR